MSRAVGAALITVHYAHYVTTSGHLVVVGQSQTHVIFGSETSWLTQATEIAEGGVLAAWAAWCSFY